MKITILEPFFGGSHRKWIEGLIEQSRHDYEVLTLSGHHWKWRMHGGAISLAKKIERSNFQPDLILATDMVDLSVFLSLSRQKTAQIPTAIYFHENQLTYPWSAQGQDKQQGRDNHYAFINYASALSADHCFFNSNYHYNSFLDALPAFLKQFPDSNNMETVNQIRKKSSILHLGLNLSRFDELKPPIIERPNRAVLLWNHRWEYDKNPEGFFDALFQLQDRGIDFRLAILGEHSHRYPKIFDRAKELLNDKILHWGYAETAKEYAYWLWHSDILPVTSNQDFFGGSVIEAAYCGVNPLMPKRLAYPEHFPNPALESSFYYDNPQSLIKQLQGSIMNVRILRKQATRKHIEHYDWKVCGDKYDQVFEEVGQSKKALRAK